MPDMTPVTTSTTFVQGDPSHAFVFQWGFNIEEFLEGSDGSTGISNVVVQIQVDPDADSDVITLVENTDYTVDLDARQVIFESGDEPDDGTVIKISRFTQRSRVVNYFGGSRPTEQTMDTDNNQEFSYLQELEAELDNALKKNLQGSAWNAEGLEGTNAAPATQPDSWVTYAQVVALIGGGVPFTISDIAIFEFVGDGAETDFELTGWKALTVPDTWVAVENVLQRAGENEAQYEIVHADDSDYPSGATGSDVIRFNAAPDVDEYIEVRIIAGTVVGFIGDDSVTTNMIQDGAVTLEKLNLAGPGDAARFLRIQANGDHVIEQLQPGMMQNLTSFIENFALDRFQPPNDTLDFSNERVANLGAGIASTDAATVGQISSAINAAIRTAKGEFTMPASVGGVVTIDVGFNVERFTVSAQVNGVATHYTWDCVFTGALPSTSKEREVTVPNVAILQFKKIGGAQVRITWLSGGGVVSWAEAGWYAIGP